MDDSTPPTKHSLLQSKFPVVLPDMSEELQMSKEQFAAHVQKLFPKPTLLTFRQSKPDQGPEEQADAQKKESETTEKSAFMDGLTSAKQTVPSLDDHDGKMLTENGDVAHSDSGSPLVNLFYELEEVVGEERLQTLLQEAWAVDPVATLKIIWNARSIHLGKSNRHCFYRAMGWLYENHPLTLLSNLQWLVRPVIPKKKAQKQDKPTENGEDGNDSDATMDFEVISKDGETSNSKAGRKRKFAELESDDDEFDVKYGVAHGYWKDLLNILVLAAHDKLRVSADPRSVLNVDKPKEKKYKRDWTEGRKKKRTDELYSATKQRLLIKDSKYRALHITVARLFVEQLKLDLARLESNDKKEAKKITLAGKWAPSTKGMHDQHTTIVSSIAELMHPIGDFQHLDDVSNRETYLLRARNAYQVKTLSKLRKHLEVVERAITAENFEDIKYDRVPSLAMKQYTTLFAQKDFDRFDKYIEDVAQGQAKISGAVLLPSTLVAQVDGRRAATTPGKKATDALVAAKLQEISDKAIGGQWASLVKRIKDSGTLESSIAVCDVSGSMSGPRFQDGTCPMDSAIGLSLLVSEVTKPPFGGAFITFHSQPQVLQVGGEQDKRSFKEKVQYMKKAPWGMSTDFVAVFEKLILPMAIKNELKQEDMVKQVFVFSDMQFNAADDRGSDRWNSSYERIKEQFEKAGYEMPKLIFWNLAGGRAGYYGGYQYGDEVAPKPVTADQEGSVLVSGYSQGQLKMFLENGQFEDEEEEEVIETTDVGDDGEMVTKTVKKPKDDSLTAVRKAISHEGYRMLKVMD